MAEPTINRVRKYRETRYQTRISPTAKAIGYGISIHPRQQQLQQRAITEFREETMARRPIGATTIPTLPTITDPTLPSPSCGFDIRVIVRNYEHGTNWISYCTGDTWTAVSDWEDVE